MTSSLESRLPIMYLVEESSIIRTPLRVILNSRNYKFEQGFEVRDNHAPLHVDRELDARTIEFIKTAGYILYKRL